MRKFGILPDLANNAIVLNGIRYPALTSEEDTIEQAHRSASRVVETSPEAGNPSH